VQTQTTALKHLRVGLITTDEKRDLLLLYRPKYFNLVRGAALTGSYSTEVLKDAPASYWRLGESSGTTAADQQAKNPGTYVGSPTLGNLGLVGDGDKAVMFKAASSQFVRVPDGGAAVGLDLTTGCTLEAIVRPTDLAGEHHIVNKNHYNLIFSGDQVRFELELNDGTNFNRFQAFGVHLGFQAGYTYHVAAVYDKTAATMTTYMNGVASGSPLSVPAGRNITTDDDPLCIGCNYNGAEYFFDGVIDEVAVYGTALSATRIATHYTAMTG